jgi:hypothetical protein
LDEGVPFPTLWKVQKHLQRRADFHNLYLCIDCLHLPMRDPKPPQATKQAFAQLRVKRVIKNLVEQL